MSGLTLKSNQGGSSSSQRVLSGVGWLLRHIGRPHFTIVQYRYTLILHSLYKVSLHIGMNTIFATQSLVTFCCCLLWPDKTYWQAASPPHPMLSIQTTISFWIQFAHTYYIIHIQYCFTTTPNAVNLENNIFLDSVYSHILSVTIYSTWQIPFVF